MGYDEAEMKKYQALGEEIAKASKGRDALHSRENLKEIP
jgi:hypothetical protein